MSLSDLASLATVASSIAVLLSLIYLGMQTHQNSKHTRALIEQARNQQIIEAERLYVSDREVRSLSIRGDAADPTLNDDEVKAYAHLVSARLMLFEDFFYQYRAGLIGQERHASTLSALKHTLARRPGFRIAWNTCKVGLGKEFRALVEQVIAETPARAQSDTVAAWRAAARASAGDAS